MQVFERGGELLLFGNRTLEFWAPTGDSNVFLRTRVLGSTRASRSSTRCAKPTTASSSSGATGGQPQVCRLDGYQVRVVSTPDVETA